MAVVAMKQLLEAGVHFGHQTRRWDPKMAEYIFQARNGIHIIDLQKTSKKIDEAYKFMKEISEEGKSVLFVGTKKQAQECMKEAAQMCGMYYVDQRWLGGMLTNFGTIRTRIQRLKNLETMQEDGTFDVLPKKEVIGLKKEYAKLDSLLCGIRGMNKLPDAMIIVDPSKEEIAIKEARKLNIPVFGIVDTNCDPDMVDYVIPGNDDAIRAVKLVLGVLANAIVEVNGGQMLNFISADEKQPSDIMQKALETVKRKEDRRKPNNDRPNFKKENNREEVKEEKKAETKKEEVKPIKEEKATKKEEKAEVKVDLTEKTVAELRELAKAKDIKGYSTMKKAELIDALK